MSPLVVFGKVRVAAEAEVFVAQSGTITNDAQPAELVRREGALLRLLRIGRPQRTSASTMHEMQEMQKFILLAA